MKKLLITIVTAVTILGAGFSTLTPVLFAQSENEVCEGVGAVAGGTGCTPSGGTTVQGVVRSALRLFQIIIGIVTIFMVSIAGLKFITSQGNPQEIATARNTLLYSAIGILVVALSEVIIRFVLNRAATP